MTDRCDFRCVYCMDEKMQFVPRTELLSLEEIAIIAQAFTELGVSKLRITGGEPLVRRNVINLFENIGQLPGLKELVLTTNGAMLTKFAEPLKAAGVKRINISLDSLDADKFKQLTRTGKLAQVLAGIDAAIAVGFEKIKLNTVILKNINDDEIIDLVNYASSRKMDISFIEEMPLGIIGSHDRAVTYYASDNIKHVLNAKFTLLETTTSTGGPAKYYQLAETGTLVGFISPHSHNFCEQCNRVRLTCKGRLLLCLGQEHSVDLRDIIRTYPGNMEKLKATIEAAMAIKPKGHDFNLNEQPIIFRHMNATGG